MLKLSDITAAPNTAELLEDSVLAQIGSMTVEGFEDDYDSVRAWMENMTGMVKMAMQLREKKSTPWPDASNVKYPLLTVSAMQFAARAYPIMVPGRSVCKAVVVGKDPQGKKAAQAARISSHISYQLLEEMEQWEDDTDRLLHIAPIAGLCFRKIYFDPVKQINKSELVMPHQLIVNYYAKSLDSAERVTQIIEITPNEVMGFERKGLWLKNEYGEPVKQEQSEVTEGRGLKASGTFTPHTFLESHCWLDLDEDGYKEPYIVTVHKDSQKVARIEPRFDSRSVYLNADDEVEEIQPFKYFVKYPFIPAPDGGFYDIGFGQLLGPINETANTLINQLIDAGTLANMGGGFMGRGARMKGGIIGITPGKWTPIDTPGNDLRQAMVPYPIRDPSNVLFSLLGLINKAGERLGSITEPLVGESPGTHVPYATTRTLIDEGLKVFSGVAKRLHRAFRHELRMIFDLNSMYLSQDRYAMIMDDPEANSETDYGPGLNIIPASDPATISDGTRNIKAEVLKQFAQDPHFDGLEVRRRYLEAMEIPDIDKLLLPKENRPDPAIVIKTAELELEKERIRLEAAKLELKRQEMLDKQARIRAETVDLKAAALTKLAEMESETLPAEQAEAAQKYGALLGETDARRLEAGAQGMAQTPGNGEVPGVSQGGGIGGEGANSGAGAQDQGVGMAPDGGSIGPGGGVTGY